MDAYPNLHGELSAGSGAGAIGRDKTFGRDFLVRRADRILFGIDAGPSLATYQLYYRFLETDDEYFSYSPKEPPGQGRWRIYGLFLPDEALEKIYYRNAERVILRKPQSGAVRIRVPVALFCVIPSPSAPMSCRRKSENGE